MRKLLGLIAVGLMLYSTPITGSVEDDNFFKCPSVCKRDKVVHTSRYVQFINNTTYHYLCSIIATNGAYYDDIILAPRTLSRSFVINDYTAKYSWVCKPA